MTLEQRTKKFRKQIEELPREDIIDILRVQDPEVIKQINRIEWVFTNKLQHLSWKDRNSSFR